MKIALLHYTTWPQIGGVENVLRDQAAMLVNAGHEVKILSGAGEDPEDGSEFVLMPELAPNFELNKQVRDVLTRGQSDQSFSQYRSVLVEAIQQQINGVDMTFVHNAFTLHFNLALTRALHDLAPRNKLIAWTHDLTATNADYALPNPTQPPWNLMRTACPDATYVAVSEPRAAELKAHLKLKVEPRVVPDLVDSARLFLLSNEMASSLTSLAIPWRDYIFLLPAKVMLRKNLDFAIEIVKKLCDAGRNPLLFITGTRDENSAAAEHYGTFLRQSLSREMLNHVVFVNEFFPVRHDIMRDLYLLSDCLLFPSKQEGFGLPLVEAALHRMPIWSTDMPAYRALEGSGVFLLDKMEKLPEALRWLDNQPTFRQQRRARRLFDPAIVYRKHYESLLAEFAQPRQNTGKIPPVASTGKIPPAPTDKIPPAPGISKIQSAPATGPLRPPSQPI